MENLKTEYDWTYFKNKYKKYIKKANTDNRKMESVLKKRKYGDAFDQDTFEFMRFGEIIGDKYVFKLPLYDLHIPLYEDNNQTNQTNQINQTNKINEDENKMDIEEKREDANEEEGIKIIFEEKEDQEEVKEELIEEVKEESKFNYDDIKESVDKNISILIDQIAAVYGYTNIKNRVETLY